ncbi:MAG: hypothetical protein QM813_03765 [Verrucomicrobiota bacterium]
MADNEQKYYAFLSCSPEDSRAALSDSSAAGRRSWSRWLEEVLKAYVIPPELVGQINGRGEIIPERIASVFRDESELSAPASLSAEMRLVLERSNCLIVICSPRSAQCRQVNAVVSYFKQLGRGHQILPFVIAGTPNASNGHPPGAMEADECYVPALRHPVNPDGTVDTARLASKHAFVDARYGVEKREILATDHRTAAAELERAKIQLIALLLGVGFDVLWARQQKFHFLELMEAQEEARETLHQVAEVRRQLQEAEQQAREAQRQALEQQNLPRAVQEQIQEAHNQAAAAQQQSREAQQQLQEVQNKVRETQAQLEEARGRAHVAESKVRDAQQAAQEAQNQVEATRLQARMAQEQVLEVQTQTQTNQVQEAQNQILNAQRDAQHAQSQLAEIRQQAQDAQNKLVAAQNQVQEFQNQAQAAQSQLAEARQQIHEAQSKVVAAENQAREALTQVQETQKQTRDAQGQIKVTQDQVREIQERDRVARRLTKVWAVLAALALLAVGVVARNAGRQRELDGQALAQATAEAAGKIELATSGVTPIREALQKIGGAEQDGNRRSSLDRLAAGVSVAEIPEVLKAAAVLVDDQQRSRFQKLLLVRLGEVNPLTAMTNASAVEGTIVTDQGQRDSSVYFQLAVLDHWLQADWPAACKWVCQLPDGDARQRTLDKIIGAVQAQPDSKAKHQQLVQCISALVNTDIYGALALAESLPDDGRFSVVIASIWTKAALLVVDRLGLPPETILSREEFWAWPLSLPTANVSRPESSPVTTKETSPDTNGAAQVQPQP